MNNLMRRHFMRGKKAADPTESFIITVSVGAGGTFTLPLISSGTYNFDVIDWGDGISDTITAYNQAEVTHTYTDAGTYDIEMNGVIEGWAFNNGGDKGKILLVKQWGGENGIKFTNATGSFRGCSNLQVTATDIPNFSLTNTLTFFFLGCSNLTGNSSFNNWDVSNISDFFAMFQDTDFNQDISNWTMSSAVNLRQMFTRCRNFNQPIGNWERVGSTMANVTSLRSTFQECDSFNQDISNWDTSEVTTMFRTFQDTISFDQNLSAWNISKLTTAQEMFKNITLSTVNYEALLIGWEAQSVQNNVTFDGGNSKYTAGSAAETARQNLITDHSWTITDGGSI